MKTQLQSIAPNIWIYNGSKVSFYGFPYTTRMTIIKLYDGSLWLHSPEKINTDLIDELAILGEVKYLISPNKLHHLFLLEWINEYPDAKAYAAPGLVKKRKDITFDCELSDIAEDEWKKEISQLIFKGSAVMDEVVFFHKPSSTLILTDLIENFNPDSFNWWQKPIARFAGIVYPNGKMPIDWRLSFFVGSKKKARDSLKQILDWHPQNIVLSHGRCIFGGAAEFLKTSFSWLQKTD